jgi:hypothetical protein
MADFIVSQLSVQVPTRAITTTMQADSGVSVEKWTATSGTPLMYNGQGTFLPEESLIPPKSLYFTL